MASKKRPSFASNIQYRHLEFYDLNIRYGLLYFSLRFMNSDNSLVLFRDGRIIMGHSTEKRRTVLY